MSTSFLCVLVFMCVCVVYVSGQSATQNDLNTLNYALTLEQLENAYYAQGLAVFNQAAFAAAGFNSTVYVNIQMISQHEASHVALLTQAINNMAPGTAAVACTYPFTFPNVSTFLTTAAVFENVGQSAYDGALNFFTSTTYAQVAATIATIEARHAAYLNQLTNYSNPFPVAFDPANTPATVIGLVTPYLGNCSPPQLAGIPTVRPSGVALNSNGTGTNRTGSAGGIYTAAQAANDLLALNYALILERFEYAFYQYVLNTFTAASFSSTVYAYLQQIALHETVHVLTLAAVITSRNGTVYPNCTYSFGAVTSPTVVISTAQLLENTGVMAYDGAANTITDTNLQQVAATIATVEARHAAILNILVNATASPYPTVNNSGLDTATPPAGILAAVLGSGLISCGFTPSLPQVLGVPGVAGDPAFTGFYNQHFQIHGLPNKVFNIISTPTLQASAKFKMIEVGQAMTAGQMKQVRLLQQIQAGTSATSLPITTAFSHAGTFLGEMGIKLLDHRVYVLAGGYQTGLAKVTLDGVLLPISNQPVRFNGDMAVIHPNAHIIMIDTKELSFSIVNSDGFVNIEQAQLNIEESADMMIEGLLGQTADSKWSVQSSVAFKQHMIMDYLVADDDLFSDDFVANMYTNTATIPTGGATNE